MCNQLHISELFCVSRVSCALEAVSNLRTMSISLASESIVFESKDTSLLHYITYKRPTKTEWLLLIHGAGGSTRTWKRQIDELGAEYNLLVIDLPGHGNSRSFSKDHPKYSFNFMSDKIWDVIDHVNIEKLHIIGVSLGTVICLQMRISQPDRVLSIIMPGAIVKLNTKLKLVANLSLMLAKVIGFRNFYSFSAHIMMPRNNHKKSRDTFIREAKALTINEFKKWTSLYYNLNKTLLGFFKSSSAIPHLLIMGSQDHLFLEPAKSFSAQHPNSELSVIQNCGHVVSIERAKQFNQICLQFLKSIS